MRVQTKRSSDIARQTIDRYKSWQAAREAMYEAEKKEKRNQKLKL